MKVDSALKLARISTKKCYQIALPDVIGGIYIHNNLIHRTGPIIVAGVIAILVIAAATMIVAKKRKLSIE